MIKRGIFCAFIAMAITISGFSDNIVVTGNAPTFKAADPNNANVEAVIEQFNDKINDLFQDFIGDIQDMVDDYIPPGLINSNNLLTGFGTSSVFASHGATMRAYADYSFLSISIGSLLGLKLPDNTINDLANGDINLNRLMNDMNLGINPQFFSLHVGINPSTKFEIMPKNLSFGLRLGFFGLPKLDLPFGKVIADLNFNTFTIGVTANYQLLATIDLVEGIIKWRGLSVGSGLIFQTTNLDIAIPFPLVPVNIPDIGPLTNLKLALDPRAMFHMKINTLTIPVEVTTAIKLLFFNFPLGIGFDLGFGASELSVGAKSGVKIEGDNNSLVTRDKDGSLSLGIENNNIPPDIFNFKIMMGLGFTFGDVFVIDIPITWYITDGFNLGFTLGARF